MAESIAFAADASRLASLLLSYIPAVCAFVALASQAPASRARECGASSARAIDYFSGRSVPLCAITPPAPANDDSADFAG